MSTTKTSTSDAGPVAESLVSRLIVAPVLFVSFLVSLMLIDRKTYRGVFGSRDHVDEYYHSHQRKLAKQEVEEAFQLRSKVIAGFCLAGGVGFAIIGFCLSKLWHVFVHKV